MRSEVPWENSEQSKVNSFYISLVTINHRHKVDPKECLMGMYIDPSRAKYLYCENAGQKSEYFSA